MKKSLIRVVFATLVFALVAGCASQGQGYGQAGPSYSRSSPNYYNRDRQVGAQEVYRGTVVSVRPVAIGRENGVGMGAVVGALIGGVVGNQVGHGSGRELATIGGAVAGGVAGNSIQNRSGRRDGLEITVRLDNGKEVAVIQDADEPFYAGDRVQVVGYGQDARVIHR